MKYLVFDVGCIECGETSNLIGMYDNLFDAKEARAVAEAEQRANWSGQHWMGIWDLETKAEVDD